MDAAQQFAPQHAPRRGTLARVCVTFLPLVVLVVTGGLIASARQPAQPVPVIPDPNVKPASVQQNPRERLLPQGDGLRDLKNPNWSTDPNDPYPMPPELANVELMKQTAAEAYAKSASCLGCHKGVGDPHGKDTLRIGCTDCHGGDASATEKDKSHVLPKNPQLWLTSANPVRSYALLNLESPQFIRFVNPGDLRIAHISCGTAGCHPKEVQTNRKQIMTTGCMLIGAAAYNNGTLPIKLPVVGEAYSMNGAPVRLKTHPAPTLEETLTKGVLFQLDPVPRFEMFQPGNIFRIFEPGGRFVTEVGIPEKFEEPGRPRTKLSIRGLGTQNRTDPVLVSANKTRLFDPTLNFMGTNDNPGDYRNSGCTACHVIYANDRSPVHSGPYAKYGHRGLTVNPDPTIPKNEPGHPIEHKFTNAIPTSQCMVCHIHPGTTVMNSYIGYMWWDEESDGRFMYPTKQKNPTAAELLASMRRNPNESAARGNLADPEFTARLSELNPHLSKVHFADFHSHGWAFRAVFKKDRKGNLIDHAGAFVGPPSAKNMEAAVKWPERAKEFHAKQNQDKYADPVSGPKAARDAETALNGACRSNMPVHLMDIHMEKGMHCVDCHFSQDMHGNNRLHMEVRAATEIACIDCHGTPKDYTTLKTSGPANYTSAPDGMGRNLLALKTPYGGPRFEVREGPNGTKRFFQNSCVEKGLQWELVQVKDTITRGHPRYNEKSELSKTVRFEGDKMVWGDLPDDPKNCAHSNHNMTCIACHSAWNPSCFGCHLPQRANLKMPYLHAEGETTRNYSSYNFQTLRDDVFMLARDGAVTGGKINPARSSCAIHVGSYNGLRESIYIQQPPVSGEGYGGMAFSTNVPHTVRGRGARETKQCTDCHVSKQNDNNAWLAQLQMQGTGIMNFVGKYAWVAAGEEGLFGIAVTTTTEPQAVFGSDLHRWAYPDNYKKHAEAGGLLKQTHEHPGRDIFKGFTQPLAKSEVLQVQHRGEYLFAACGEGGFRAFDIAFIDDKAFAERITTAPVSPVGQKFVVKTKYAQWVCLPSTVPLDPMRKPFMLNGLKINFEQPIHPMHKYAFVCDKYEGLVVVDVTSAINGNPVDNFFKKELCFNPDGLLYNARHAVCAGHFLYVSCDAGLVVLDISDPLNPKHTATVGEPHLKGAKMCSVQFRYCYVADAEGVKVLDVTDLAKPVPKSMIRLADARSLYLARTHCYVAAGARGLVILDITDAEAPKVEHEGFTAGGHITDATSVSVGVTYNSLFAYVADGKNGFRVIQMFSPESPGYEGFSVKPTPRLVSTYQLPHGGKIVNVSRGLDRDRAVDETGHQIGVFGRLGARPFNFAEQRKMYLHNNLLWRVSDDPKDVMYHDKGKK